MATVTSKQDAFKPIVITLENLEEVELMYEMLAFNVSIPNIVYSDSQHKNEKLVELMRTIRNGITKVIT